MAANSQPDERNAPICSRCNQVNHTTEPSGDDWQSYCEECKIWTHHPDTAPQPVADTAPERELGWPWDEFPEDASTWQECVRQFRQARLDASLANAQLAAAGRQLDDPAAPNANAPISRFQFALETCDAEHDYAFIVGRPKPRCPWCLAQGLKRARAELEVMATPSRDDVETAREIGYQIAVALAQADAVTIQEMEDAATPIIASALKAKEDEAIEIVEAKRDEWRRQSMDWAHGSEKGYKVKAANKILTALHNRQLDS